MHIMLSIKSSLTLLCLIVIINSIVVQSACNICQENGAACLNLTSFNLCFGSSEPGTQLFDCPPGLECTDLPNICFQSSPRPASCGDTTSCGKCNHNQVFACTSRTTFLFCFGAELPSTKGGTCPPEKSICDASSQAICVEHIQPSSIVCDIDAPL